MSRLLSIKILAKFEFHFYRKAKIDILLYLETQTISKKCRFENPICNLNILENFLNDLQSVGRRSISQIDILLNDIMFENSLNFIFIVSALPKCMHVYHMFVWCKQKNKRTINVLKMDLLIVMSCHLVTGNWTRAFIRVLYLRVNFSFPQYNILIA